MAELLSPNAATLSGKSAPHIPGPSIGSMRTTLAPILTEPDFMQATSASCLQGARSPNMKPRPQPASASSTPAPTRQNPAPFFMLAKMRAVPLTRLQRLPPAIPLRIRNPCQQTPTALNGPTLSAHIKQAAGGRITPQEIMPKRSCPKDHVQEITPKRMGSAAEVPQWKAKPSSFSRSLSVRSLYLS